jgi:hypothetical protein
MDFISWHNIIIPWWAFVQMHIRPSHHEIKSKAPAQLPQLYDQLVALTGNVMFQILNDEIFLVDDVLNKVTD